MRSIAAFILFLLFAIGCKHNTYDECICHSDDNYSRITTLSDSLKNRYVVYVCKSDTNRIMFKYYWDNGLLQGKFYFVQHQKNGHWVQYSDDGSLSFEGDFSNNKKIGTHISYYRNGNIASLERYNSLGKKIGLNYYFKENGNIKQKNEIILDRDFLGVRIK